MGQWPIFKRSSLYHGLFTYRFAPCRFDIHARRALKLDDFIQCCVMLRCLTDAFRQRDTNMNGVINVSYEDFMCMCLQNKP